MVYAAGKIILRGKPLRNLIFGSYEDNVLLLY